MFNLLFSFCMFFTSFFYIDTIIYCRNRSRIFFFSTMYFILLYIFNGALVYKKKSLPHKQNPHSKSRKIPLSRKNIKQQFISLCSGMKFYFLFLKHFFVTSKDVKSPVVWNTYYRWYDHFCKLFYQNVRNIQNA